MSFLSLPGTVAGGVLDPIANKVRNPFNDKQVVELGGDFPEGFKIIEIVNGQERPTDAVTLIGNMMPMIPFTFGGEQRITKDYYPGNSEPSVQVLGPKESDVVIHGKLKDKKYRNANELRGVSTLIQKQIDGIRIRGNLVKITLGGWQRYAFLEQSTFKLNKLSEVEYELKFSIVGFNAPRNFKLAGDQKQSPTIDNKNLIAAAAKYQADHYNQLVVNTPRSISDTLNAAISDVASAVVVVTNFVDGIVTTAEGIQASANRAIGVIKNARTNLAQFKRRVGALSTAYNSLSSDAKSAAKFKTTIQNMRIIHSAMSGTNDLSALLARLQKQFESISKTVPTARYVVKSGDTLQKISMKYYNTASYWDKIYDHNKLTSTTLVLGSVLEIPRV